MFDDVLGKCPRLPRGARVSFFKARARAPCAPCAPCALHSCGQALLPKRNESNVEQLLREWDSLKRGLEMPGGPAISCNGFPKQQVCTKMCQASMCSNRLSVLFLHLGPRLSFGPRQ